ncbi:MAG: ATP-binding protein [Actinomycetota bacterium]
MKLLRAIHPRGGRTSSGEPAMRRVWLLNAALALIAGVLYATVVHGLAPIEFTHRLPWWLVALGFAATEVLVVHLQYRREAHTFSLSEMPLVVGLFVLAPGELVAAQLLGAGLALALHRRQSIVKLAFNLANWALQAQVAVLVFRSVSSLGAPDGPAGWVGALVAILAVTLIGVVSIFLAISASEGRREREVFPRTTWLALSVAVGAAGLGLLVVVLLDVGWGTLSLLAVPMGLLILVYRGYTAEAHRHASLQFLYEATRTAQETIRIEDTMVGLLGRARDMFRAEIGEILFFPDEDGQATRTVVGLDGVAALEPVDLDPAEGVWARIASEGESILLPRPIQSERLLEHFGARGIRDAMIAPLLAEGRLIGMMTVANRNGDVTTFDASDLQLFETLANHASVALENARLVRRLEDSLEHLTEMNRLKDDFVATVSHELRTPLTSVQGTIKTLRRAKSRIDPEAEASLLEAADRQSDRLRQLIENLLIVGRIESHQVAADMTEVAVGNVIERVAEEVVGYDAAARVQVVLERGLPQIDTDEGKLHQVVLNLLENALKYSPAESPVIVRAAPQGEGVTLSIEDRGQGIPAEVRDRIFDRFFQVDQTSTRSVGGTGLGLYICKQLADALGGRLWLERSDASGSVFSLWLPLGAVAVPAPEPVTLPA